MGNIPEFQTRRLASAVTPTLGADPHAGSLQGGIAAGLATIGGVLKGRKAEKQKVLDVVEAESMLRDFEAEMKGASDEIKQKFAEQPDDGVKQIGTAGEQLIKLKLDDIKNQNVKMMFARGASASLRNQGKAADGWANVQKVVKADENFSRVTIMQSGDLKAEPYLEGEPITAKFERELGYHEDRVKLSQGIYGKQSAKKMQEGREGLSKSWLHGLMNDDPLVAKELLERGYFTGLMSGKDIEAYEAKAKNKIKGWQEEVKFESTLAAFGNFKGLQSLWFKGELNIAAVDVAEDKLYTQTVKDGKGGEIPLIEAHPELQEHIDTIREIVATRKDITFKETIESMKVSLAIEDEIRRMQIDSDKMDATATLEQLIDVQGKIYKAVLNGQLAPKKAEYFLNQMETPTVNTIDEAKDTRWFKSWRAATPESTIYDSTNTFLENGNFSPEAQGRMKSGILTDVIDQFNAINSARESYGGSVSVEEAKVIVQKAIKNAETKESALFGDGKEKTIRLRNGKVITINKDSVKRVK